MGEARGRRAIWDMSSGTRLQTAVFIPTSLCTSLCQVMPKRSARRMGK
jgi:hypothetical protein